MKVLMFVHTYYPNKDGIAVHCYNLVNALREEGVDVKVVNPRKSIRIPGLSSGILPDIESIDSALRGDYDIIHVHGYSNLFSVIGAIIGIIRGKKVVWTIHGIPDRHRLFHIYNAFAIHLLRRAKVISVSRKIERIHKNYTLIYNGVDLDRFRCNHPYKDNRIVTYIGRLDRDKGIERLIEEYSGEIEIVGSDEDGYKNQLISKARENVRFLEVDYDRINEVYCRSRYIVLPSRYEGFPMVMLESLAAERPFLATPVGEIPQFLEYVFGEGYRKYIIDRNIGEVIMRLDSMDLRDELRKAREKLQELSWKRVAKKTIEVYRDAMGR
ncbi:MAG: glycosyltransferase family 4 protein [Candidatus Micrarchaeota archaeon]|nr:glycosyltransferase family 4 protein [Candidatus Micrarchaeota archaeon]MCX8154226.1 glycosyltransferase family 4 protein [Candidatus Micrarchaeota archaeon]